jgi:hypothetical protein
MRRGLAWSLKIRQNGSGPKSENRDLSSGVDFIFGLAKNARLNRVIGAELTARDESRTSGAPARRFKGAHPVDAQELEPHAPLEWRSHMSCGGLRDPPGPCPKTEQAAVPRGGRCCTNAVQNSARPKRILVESRRCLLRRHGTLFAMSGGSATRTLVACVKQRTSRCSPHQMRSHRGR